MTWECLLLALLATDVGRSREITVPRSIERTLLRIGSGLVESAGTEEGLRKLCTALEGDGLEITIRDQRLYVDGKREGKAVCRILRGLATIGLFVVDRATPGASVELRYTLLYRGLAIHRRVTITDGQIRSTASFACEMGPQGRVRHVYVSYVARESPSGTTVTTTARLTVNTGVCSHRATSRFKVVNRAATRQISEHIDAALASAEAVGRRLSADGHAAIVGHVTHVTEHLLRWTR